MTVILLKPVGLGPARADEDMSRLSVEKREQRSMVKQLHVCLLEVVCAAVEICGKIWPNDGSGVTCTHL